MGLHNPGIRVFAQHVVDIPQVLGRLEHPGISRTLPLQQLQPATVILEDLSHVFGYQPLLILIHPKLHIENHRDKIVGKEGHTLLWQLCTHGVHVAEVWQQLVYPGQLLLALANTWIAAIARCLRWREWVGYLPTQGCTELRVQCH